MSVDIFSVTAKSKCDKKGIKSGDKLLSVNGNEINDVLDYRFYASEEKLKMLFLTSSGKTKKVKISHSDGCDNLGLEFETYLMDKQHHCKNACIFCFVDQMPKGMRKSLYFKDDDARLSFLFGNYITLTNLSDADVERIIKMHISPINASVHTMNPQLRVKMMKNPFAGESLSFLKRFSDAGIKINTQLVLCPGINDGDELRYSLNELSKLENVVSIAAVPVGLTKYRDGLFPLKPYEKNTAGEVIDIIDEFNVRLEKEGKTKIAFPSDEFFQLAQREFPDYSYYGDFPQLDNGVGMYVSMYSEFVDAMNETEADTKKREFAFATGEAAFGLIDRLSREFCEKFTQSNIKGYKIKNRFFGENVTVAGLITGKDLIDSLKKEKFSSPFLLLPSVMLKSAQEPIFLDDIGIEEVEKELCTKVITVPSDGNGLFDLFYSM